MKKVVMIVVMLGVLLCQSAFALTPKGIVMKAYEGYRGDRSVEQSLWTMNGDAQMLQVITFGSDTDTIMASFYKGSSAIKRLGFIATIPADMPDDVLRTFCPGGRSSAGTRNVSDSLVNSIPLDFKVQMPWAMALMQTGIGDIAGNGYDYATVSQDDSSWVIAATPVNGGTMPTRTFTIRTSDLVITKIVYTFIDGRVWTVQNTEVATSQDSQGAFWSPVSIYVINPDGVTTVFNRLEKSREQQFSFPAELPCR